ncbi:MAG: hypothetical protein LBB75_06735 [Oscillospiraceae bacterium]|jgi:hypothetical protein|nr:hypothetical protein [Oscillospiraceae bacterium]
MKRIVASILALGLLLALAGCRGNSTAAEEQTTEHQTAEALVTSYTALNENQRFPLINLEFPEALRINAEVRAYYDRIVPEGDEYEACDFFCALHGGVLSLIFCRSYDGYSMYQTYHMNTRTGGPVTNRELLELAGWAQEALLENLRGKIERFYRGTENLPEGFPHAEYRAKAHQALEDIETLRLYLSGSGRLFWVAELASMGGAAAREILIDPAQPDEWYTPESQKLNGHWEMLG